MAKRQTIIPQYGTVMKKGVLYDRTRIKDANGKLIALDAKTPEELYKRETIALEQIEKKNYEATLVEKGIPREKIRKYGFAFCGKKVLIGSKI